MPREEGRKKDSMTNANAGTFQKGKWYDITFCRLGTLS